MKKKKFKTSLNREKENGGKSNHEKKIRKKTRTDWKITKQFLKKKV